MGKLRKAKDAVATHQAQGEALAFETLLNLEGDILQYEADLKSGKIGPQEGQPKETAHGVV
jgi:hypothetical protein